MYCAQCGYDLRAARAGACPECGGAFDPRDPSTYRTRRPATARRLGPYLAVVAMVITVAVVVLSFPLLFMFVALRIVGTGDDAAIGPAGAFLLGFLLDLAVVGPGCIVLLLRTANRILPLDQPVPDDGD